MTDKIKRSHGVVTRETYQSLVDALERTGIPLRQHIVNAGLSSGYDTIEKMDNRGEMLLRTYNLLLLQAFKHGLTVVTDSPKTDRSPQLFSGATPAKPATPTAVLRKVVTGNIDVNFTEAEFLFSGLRKLAKVATPAHADVIKGLQAKCAFAMVDLAA